MDRKSVQSIAHLDETTHNVFAGAHPFNGGTAYYARCLWCGESWMLQNREYAKIRLDMFREEPCQKRG